MKNTNKILFSLLLLVGVVATSCENLDVISNGVYISEAQNATSKKLSIDNTGGSGSFTVRLAEKVESDIQVVLSIDPTALDAYNNTNGTAYKMLPESYFTLSSQELLIKAGKISAEPIVVSVKAFGADISKDDVYAVPVTISSVSGGVDVLGGSKKIVMLIDEIIVTSVPYVGRGNNIIYSFPEEKAFHQFTLEWNINKDEYDGKNCSQWVVGNSEKPNYLYTRFIKPKVGPNFLNFIINGTESKGTTNLTPNKWYHLAFVSDGVNITLYVNGVQVTRVPYLHPGQPMMIKDLYFGNHMRNVTAAVDGYVSELRLWSVARSASEVLNNIYRVNPNTEGLEVYWKANDSDGQTIKDHSPNKRDGKLYMPTKWLDGVRFPEGM